MSLTVLDPGALTTVQDLGRAGLAHLGVPPGGAADRSSFRLANRLVGNEEGAAALETTLGGLVVRAERAVTAAVTGAAGPLTLDGTPVPRDAVLRVPRGGVLEVGLATAGLRSYLAVRGGLDVAPELGSRSTDTMSRLGPPVVRERDVLALDDAAVGWPCIEVAPVPQPPAGPVRLDAVPGPRSDRLAAGELGRLGEARWRVAAASDRVGLRLEGPALALAQDAEWPSEGTVRGALQVPPNGHPVLFLADHPVTGGYPVVAVVVSAHVDRAAQLRPGQPVRFRLVRPPDLGT
jgi:biotin-dependent carboxylase-like uncharacterized protein